MNNLHRELAPISDAAWALIEEEVTRTFKRHLAGRRARASPPSAPATCGKSPRRGTASTPASGR